MGAAGAERAYLVHFHRQEIGPSQRLIDLRSHRQYMPTPVCPGPLQYSIVSNSVILSNLLGENSVSLEFYGAFFVL